jgi:hypothetical protein
MQSNIISSNSGSSGSIYSKGVEAEGQQGSVVFAAATGRRVTDNKYQIKSDDASSGIHTEFAFRSCNLILPSSPLAKISPS